MTPPIRLICLMRLPRRFAPLNDTKVGLPRFARNDTTNALRFELCQLFIPLAVNASAVILAVESVTVTQFHTFLKTVLFFKVGFQKIYPVSVGKHLSDPVDDICFFQRAETHDCREHVEAGLRGFPRCLFEP